MPTTAGLLSPETPQSSKYGGSFSNGHPSGYDSDQPIASSPLMRKDPSTPQQQFRSSTASRNSSARLSRDLDNWRDSLALSTAGTEFEDDDKNGEREGRHSPSPTTRPNNTSQAERKEGPDDSSYSSQQLDDILNIAKNQLSRLEGKVKGARYSLAEMPSLASYSPTSASSSPIKSSHGATGSVDDTKLNRSPRINFAPPRTNSSFSTSKERTDSRHARNYSDTSVPSPQGQVPKGSIAARPGAQRELPNRLSLRELPAYRNTKITSDLDPVLEEATSPRKTTHTIPENPANAKRLNQLSSLRRDAELVRDRLSVIQSGVFSAVERRRSWRDGTTSVLPEEVEQIKEVDQLEKLLQRQEAFLLELEQPEVHDENNEWREIERHKDYYNSSSFQDLTDEDDVDSDLDTDSRGIPEEAFLEGELEPDFEESHEDRADAFDYEHFIIHSVLNTAKLAPAPRSRGSSSASSDTVSTARGRGVDDFDEEEEEEEETDDRHGMGGLNHSNQSTASFATAHSFMDLESDHEDQTSDDERELLTDNEAWPLPPSAGSARSSGTSSGSGRPNSNEAMIAGARPASLIYSAVVNPLAGGPHVSEDDETLIRSLAEAMRHACRELQRHGGEPSRADDWRYRLEEARRLLSGESEIF